MDAFSLSRAQEGRICIFPHLHVCTGAAYLGTLPHSYIVRERGDDGRHQNSGMLVGWENIGGPHLSSKYAGGQFMVRSTPAS